MLIKLDTIEFVNVKSRIYEGTFENISTLNDCWKLWSRWKIKNKLGLFFEMKKLAL